MQSHGKGLGVKLALGAAALLVIGLGWWRYRADADGSERYVTRKVTQGDIEETVSALGSLQPFQYVDVGTQVSGQLQKILVDYGAQVKKGQLLAEIDPTVYQSRVSADEAQLLNLKAQITEKTAQAALARLQWKRQRELMARNATSRDAYDTADAGFKAAQAQIVALQAQVQQTESTLRGDRANLGYTKIYAPMDGTVVNVIARQGQTLNANQQAPIILRIADLDTMTVWTQVSEADEPKLKLGMPAYFTTLGEPNRRREGVLRQILPTPEVVNNVVLYDSLFDVPNPDHRLLPQMSAEVFFVVAQARNVPLVPLAALRREAGAWAVQVMEDGKPVERPVTVGVRNRITAEILSGLKPGDEVVVDQSGRGAERGEHIPPGARTPRL